MTEEESTIMEGVIEEEQEELGSSGHPEVHRQLFQGKQWILRANRGMTHPTGIFLLSQVYFPSSAFLLCLSLSLLNCPVVPGCFGH